MYVYLADENLDRRLIEALRNHSEQQDVPPWIVHSVFEDYRSIADDQVIAVANELDAVILTEDKDFGELTYRLGLANRGIVLIRLSGMPIDQKIDLVIRVLEQLADRLYGYFTVVQVERVRSRKLK